VPAYVVYRPSVMRSGRLVIRVVAVAALALAAAVAFVVLTHTGGQTSGAPSAHAAKAGAPPSRVTEIRSKPATAKVTATKTATVKKIAKPAHKLKKKRVAVPAPAHTPVAVLNGGTATGAAAALAGRLRSLGYPVPVVGNAGRRDLPMSIEYAAGLGPAARALARHLGPVRYVTPFDGPARNISGARLLVIVGN
jgi:LytR cell envelope-related transcriptional attenuator